MELRELGDAAEAVLVLAIRVFTPGTFCLLSGFSVCPTSPKGTATTTASYSTDTPSRLRANAALDRLRDGLFISKNDREALAFLKSEWPALSAKERCAVKRHLKSHGYRGPEFDMLREWAYHRLHPENDWRDSPLLPVRDPGGRRPNGPEYWPGKRNKPDVSGGLPQ